MFQENLKTLRKNKGVTQEELAARLCVVRQTVSKWEKGYSVPDAEQLSKIADFFDVPKIILFIVRDFRKGELCTSDLRKS